MAQTQLAAAPDRAAGEEAEEAVQLWREAFAYLYPLALMEITRRHQLTLLGIRMNTWFHMRQYPPAAFRGVVRPNFDTLYSITWLDLTAGPVILSVPDTAGRYYCMPLMDMWTDCFSVPGSRTTGTRAARFCITGPSGGHAEASDAHSIVSPTPYVWVILRIMTNGESDYEAVHRLQDRLAIAAAGAPAPAPAADVAVPPLHRIKKMSAAEFFDYASPLLALHPPHLSDGSVVLRMARLGLGPGAAFRAPTEAAAKGAMERGVALARASLKLRSQNVVNGWASMAAGIGVYGNDYERRAAVAHMGLGAVPPEDAVYLTTEGAPLLAGVSYLLRFEPGQLPPCGAFWSVTLYDEEGFPVANAAARHAVGSLHGLAPEPDGALELLVAPRPPAAKRSNWLPAAAAGRMSLTMRIYAPRPEVMQGCWQPPLVVALATAKL